MQLRYWLVSILCVTVTSQVVLPQRKEVVNSWLIGYQLREQHCFIQKGFVCVYFTDILQFPFRIYKWIIHRTMKSSSPHITLHFYQTYKSFANLKKKKKKKRNDSPVLFCLAFNYQESWAYFEVYTIWVLFLCYSSIHKCFRKSSLFWSLVVTPASLLSFYTF